MPYAHSDAAERALAFHYAPSAARAALTAVWQLDDILAGIVRAGREPLVAQMRLTWWHAALTGLDEGQRQRQPVLAALGGQVLTRGVEGRELAGMIDGWEMLLDPARLSEEAMAAFARSRGATLFNLSARLCAHRADALPALAGEGWALADLAAHLNDPDEARRANALALPLLEAAAGTWWPVELRMLGALVHAALARVRGERRPGPARVARMLWHRISGR